MKMWMSLIVNVENILSVKSVNWYPNNKPWCTKELKSCYMRKDYLWYETIELKKNQKKVGRCNQTEKRKIQDKNGKLV